jgi:hypothetical protein
MKLCTPAFIYLVFSAIGIILIAFQNYGMSPNMYCVGSVQCPVQSTAPIFIMKILYVVFWTFILNALCSYGYYQLSWFLLLLPFILFFIAVFLLGTFLNKRTASINFGIGSNQGQQQQQQQPPFYQQQAQQQAQMQVQSRDKQSSNWFFPETNSDQNQDGKGYYSSYGDYDHALDQRTKQVYNESREKNQTSQHYK